MCGWEWYQPTTLMGRPVISANLCLMLRKWAKTTSGLRLWYISLRIIETLYESVNDVHWYMNMSETTSQLMINLLIQSGFLLLYYEVINLSEILSMYENVKRSWNVLGMSSFCFDNSSTRVYAKPCGLYYSAWFSQKYIVILLNNFIMLQICLPGDLEICRILLHRSFYIIIVSKS